MTSSSKGSSSSLGCASEKTDKEKSRKSAVLGGGGSIDAAQDAIQKVSPAKPLHNQAEVECNSGCGGQTWPC